MKNGKMSYKSYGSKGKPFTLFLLSLVALCLLGCFSVSADQIFLKEKPGGLKPQGNEGTVLEETENYVIIRFKRSEIRWIVRTPGDFFSATRLGGEKNGLRPQGAVTGPSSDDESRPVQGYFPTRNPLILPEDMERLSSSNKLNKSYSAYRPLRKSAVSQMVPGEQEREEIKKEVKEEVLKELRAEGVVGRNNSFSARGKGTGNKPSDEEVSVGYGSVQGIMMKEGVALGRVRVKLVRVIQGDLLGGLVQAVRYGREFEATTDEKGIFVFRKLPAGEYKLKWQPLEETGWFKLLKDKPDVVVNAGEMASLEPIMLEHPQIEVQQTTHN